MGKFVKECGYFPSFLDTLVKNYQDFTLLNQLLLYVGDHIKIPCDEYETLVVDESLKTLLLGNFHGFQLYHFYFKELHFYFKELMLLLICGKKMNCSLKVLKAHLCDFVKTTFENGVFELTWKNLIEKHLFFFYSIY
ncbi:hypothetical protein M9H77_29476 [Catharanthus roseus]|uniref:Uncharacterized protein n=1 Tax=Catharanthus roseus TaxID=4058 RepID=A0ACB9ZWG2_CATRO|nr:hypothetical protein M9H77_29476 [Catharanthus roseus]